MVGMRMFDQSFLLRIAWGKASRAEESLWKILVSVSEYLRNAARGVGSYRLK